MSISQLEICNMALGRMGTEKAISALYPDENTAEARQCARFWESNRDATLSESPWKGSRKVAELSLDETAPDDPNWDYQYTLPADFIREIEVVNASGYAVNYTLVGGKLYANNDEVFMKYVFKQTDTTKYHPLLIEAMACRLAHLISMPLSGSKTLKKLMWEEYQYTLTQARTANAFEYQEDKIQKTDSWVRARFGGGANQEFGEDFEE